MRSRVVIVGIGGGTGAGKTTVAQKIAQILNQDKVVVIPEDAYYKDREDLPLGEREQVNYDHPDAFDNKLFHEHLRQLKEGKLIERPIYDYFIHRRKKERLSIEPKEVVIVEGILVLHDPRIRALMDIKVYVDTPDDIRFLRRLERDTKERGRTQESVIQQYLSTVRPMHLQFVEPTKRYADIIIPEGGYNEVAIEMVVSTIQRRLLER